VGRFGLGREGRTVPIAADGRKIVLHVGCGVPNPNKLHPDFRGPDWRELRLDIDRRVKPDIVGTIVDMSNVPSDSVDAVWSSHNIEHIHAHEVPLALHGFLRVLRPGGVAVIATPDLQWAAQQIARGNLEGGVLSSELGDISPLDIVYGHRESIRQGNDFMTHRTGFTAKTLAAKLREAGFGRVDVERRGFELRARALRPTG
jgi:predicted SAM-dependent methyltransferase